MREIFVDYANACPVDERVFSAMKPYFTEKFGNPSSHIISKGNEALKALDESRKTVANFLGAESFEIVFTGSATEANNLAIKGTAFKNINKDKKHIIASDIEHFSITSPLRTLELDFDFKVDYVPVDNDGIVEESALRKTLREDTVLITIQLANNEIGSIQDIKNLVKIVKEFNENIIFHCDASACGGLIDVNVKELDVDLLTLSPISMYGPKGIACLYIKKGVTVKPLIEGGFQEAGLRSGTENLPAIVGFAKACEISKLEMNERAKYLSRLRDKLMDGIEKNIDFVHITGHRTKRLPNNFSFWIEFAEGESLLLMLNYLGVMASSGSACSSNLRARDEDELVASPVLKAIGVPSDICTGSLTFSLGMKNTEEDIEYIIQIMPGIVNRLWQMSPFYLDKIKGHTPKMTKVDK
ncbi:MAG: cysteine desulfurase [Proteobacteria bacterium]|nr:cysteine desulfurase [Pseudomonadota bacterium]